MQAHLASARTAWELIEDADLDWQDDERIRFTATNIVDALAPSNVPVLNPLSLKAAIDTGGRSAVTGVRRLVRDLATPPRVPSMVEPDAFTVGEDLAATPGAVVFRTDVFELIRYRPTTETVRAVPLLMVPPTINKFYVADLAPGRSIVEHYLNAGQQVFMISWRNPDERHAAWGLDTYGQAVLDAMDAVEQATGQRAGRAPGVLLRRDHHLDGARAPGRDRPAGPGERRQLRRHRPRLGAGGHGLGADGRGVGQGRDGEVAEEGLPGRRAAVAEVFAWLRPNDLVWNYWVNNYLQGKPPPNFDILYWNADTTRMTAALHRDFIDIALGNSLIEPGKATMLGTPVDLSTVTVDSYVTAGIADHLCPWQACYRTHAAARRRQPVHPVDQRPHRLAGQPAGQPEVHLPGRGVHPGRPGDVAGAGGDGAGLVVAGLHDLAGRALRGRDPGADVARRRSWHRRRGRMSSTSSAPRRRASTSGR